MLLTERNIWGEIYVWNDNQFLEATNIVSDLNQCYSLPIGIVQQDKTVLLRKYGRYPDTTNTIVFSILYAIKIAETELSRIIIGRFSLVVHAFILLLARTTSGAGQVKNG